MTAVAAHNELLVKHELRVIDTSRRAHHAAPCYIPDDLSSSAVSQVDHRVVCQPYVTVTRLAPPHGWHGSLWGRQNLVRGAVRKRRASGKGVGCLTTYRLQRDVSTSSAVCWSISLALFVEDPVVRFLLGVTKT